MVCLAQAKTGSSPGGQGWAKGGGCKTESLCLPVSEEKDLSGLSCASVHLTQPAPQTSYANVQLTKVG